MVGFWNRAAGQGILAVLVMALATLAVLGVSGLVEPSQAETLPPRPFDPPSPHEQETAAEVALADPQVKARLSGEYVFLGTSLRTDKDQESAGAERQRLLDVWFYDYGTDRIVWAVVDPIQGVVARTIPVDFPFQPPLASVEVARAVELTLMTEAAAGRFPDGFPPHTAALIHGEGTSCPTNRCVAIGFIENGSLARDFLVLVNLSQDRVMGILDWQEVYRT